MGQIREKDRLFITFARQVLSKPVGRIKKVLIANRGEIACRITRTCHRLGIGVVAVYSEADRWALHVEMADEAVCIGPPPSTQSYLNIPAILEAARITGADAIHPGYGFLSENPVFARAVRDAGLIFIGPSAESMEIMGSKIAAKRAVAAYGIPLVPGTIEPVDNVEEAVKIAAEIGYPVLIKASAGGGGKGMRVVWDEGEFEENLARAQSEALSAFGDKSVFLEKFLPESKHIEVQVIADVHGHTIHLWERECSIQRRHQKVIEEAPSPSLNEEQRITLGRYAVNVARACNYLGAGTVEFIYDLQGGLYFLEMNTRLQVEHPVTEMITGLDLVELQIRVAEGEPLPLTQEKVQRKGHAIEVRVYAEDPANNFSPDTGRLTIYQPPLGEGIRVDDGYTADRDIPIYYDPMIAKLIAWAPDRNTCIDRMLEAIAQYRIGGIETTLPFCAFALNHPDFRNGSFTTKFVEKHFKPENLFPVLSASEAAAAAGTAAFLYREWMGQ
ncbi:MAG: acetyl-CoA carboxylase biotin carboxylase subunit [Flavobacteriales bacterium]|nr:acetyl-CoA carboxylase biotin carboxylase subunit [Flavobacteriales bacterium]MDW8410408.1 acetyl-CoA carboxylase biotin carboxylase subunit [Flavobacteriales bacterium]